MAVSRWPLGLSQGRWSVLQCEGRRFRLRAVEGAGVAGATPEPTRACSLAGGCGQRRWGHSRGWGSWRWVPADRPRTRVCWWQSESWAPQAGDGAFGDSSWGAGQGPEGWVREAGDAMAGRPGGPARGAGSAGVGPGPWLTARSWPSHQAPGVTLFQRTAGIAME